MMLLLVPLLASAHVPTYVGGVENCFKPPHHHTTSQVIYLKGSGGLEVHLLSNTDPFDIAGAEILDVDAVFKQKYDQSTYALYLGCGGCVASQDALVPASLVTLSGYQPGTLEPFTQTPYFSVFAPADRKYDSSQLSGCAQNHFTIRVLDHANRTDGSELVWGAVIGIGETFTVTELLSFPMFVLSNHGPTWNGLTWTAPLSFLIFAPLLVWAFRAGLRRVGWTVAALDAKFSWKGMRPYLEGKWAVRELFYEVGILAFAGTMIEMFIHLNYSAVAVGFGHAMSDWGYWVGLAAVILFANGLPIYQIVSAWRAMKHEADPSTPTWCCECYCTCSASAWWAPIEMVTGFSYLFLFGAGMWLGPACIMLAGFVRLSEIKGRKVGMMPRDGYLGMRERVVRPSLFF